MSSLDYFVFELSSAESHETRQAVSLTLKDRNGIMQILPNHEPAEFPIESQIITVQINGEKTSKQLFITDGIVKITIQHDGRSTVQLICFSYDEVKESVLVEEVKSENLFYKKTLEFQSQKAKSNELLQTELLPTLSKIDQQNRNIDQELRKEFETNL
jgi:F0F1-type ATP synthase epsilon subunit